MALLCKIHRHTAFSAVGNQFFPIFCTAILQQAATLEKGCKSVCSFCSRMKRGRLYAAARKHGYNVLALGQHLDDLAESFLMSAFHNGRLRTMKAHYYIRYIHTQ
jgi:tRNA(Ile)-lysidine synthase TilS/MesJ